MQIGQVVDPTLLDDFCALHVVCVCVSRAILIHLNVKNVIDSGECRVGWRG